MMRLTAAEASENKKRTRIPKDNRNAGFIAASIFCFVQSAGQRFLSMVFRCFMTLVAHTPVSAPQARPTIIRMAM